MRRRGFTLVEFSTGLTIFALVLAAGVSMLIGGLKSFAQTNTDTQLASTNANGMRYVAQALRQATDVSVNANGTVITYQLPEVSASVDPITGQNELIEPITADGVNRTFTVNFTAGTLVDSVSGRTLVTNIVGTDPDPGSSLYNQAYSPFTITTIGQLPAVTINLITQTVGGETTRYVRFKTSSVYHN